MKFKIEVTDEDALRNKEVEEVVIIHLHLAWRSSPNFHRLCTHALLSFDTEAGGETMDITTPATAPENPPQP